MGKMPVPCYGCGGTLSVDARRATQTLLGAGWTLERGATYCPDCRRQPAPSDAVPAEAALWHAGTRVTLELYRQRAQAQAGFGAGVLLLTIVPLAAAHDLSRFERPLFMAGLLGVTLLAGGLIAYRRAQRWGVLLAGAPWRRFILTVLPAPRWGAACGLELSPADGAGSPLLLRRGRMFKWRTAALSAADGRTVWLAGDPSSAVLALFPGPELVPVTSPRPRQQDRYQVAALKARAQAVPSEVDRRARIRKSFRRVQLQAGLLWLEVSLITIERASILGGALVIAYSALLADTLVCARRARDRALA